MKTLMAVLVVALTAAGGWLLLGDRVGTAGGAEGRPVYRLAETDRGEVVRSISASGAVRAVVTVNVGAQVSGMIETLHADFNSRVGRGEVIARIAPAPFEARLAQAEAERDAAAANLAKQRSILAELTSELEGAAASRALAESERSRQGDLAASGAATRRSVETAEAAVIEARARAATAEARLETQKAEIALAEAKVEEARAVVRQRRLDLDNAEIRSPVDGVVIHRSVDVGQIVAASLEAPTLFQIAQDLSKMQIDINLDEADVSRVQVGQGVTFVVDAYPARRFEGVVRQIRLAGQAIANVVTYTVVAEFENPDLALLPGMTADVTIVTDRREDVLRAPTAAFYFTPPGTPRGDEWRVWTLDETGAPVPRVVGFGVYDDANTEITSGLAEGEPVIVGIEPAVERGGFSWSALGFGG